MLGGGTVMVAVGAGDVAVGVGVSAGAEIASIAKSSKWHRPTSAVGWDACSQMETVEPDAVKVAEDRKELVLRVYENANCRGPVRLTFCEPPASVHELDLMENRLRPMKSTGSTVDLSIKPYEILTLGVVFA